MYHAGSLLSVDCKAAGSFLKHSAIRIYDVVEILFAAVQWLLERLYGTNTGHLRNMTSMGRSS